MMGKVFVVTTCICSAELGKVESLCLIDALSLDFQ